MKQIRKVLLVNGPNLNMLGVREPAIYGSQTLVDLEKHVSDYAKEQGIEVVCFQSNDEGELVSCIQSAHTQFDGIIYNPGAHTHYSYALRDAVGGVDAPCVEVHLSDVNSREPFRRISVIAPACVAQVKGRGLAGYCDALDILCEGANTRLGEEYEVRYEPGQVIVGGRSFVCNIDEVLFDEACEMKNASARRLGEARAFAQRENLDVVLARNTSDIRWLTAFDDVFDDEQAHAMVITLTEALLHTDSRYSQAARVAAEKEGVISVDDSRDTHTCCAVAVAERLSCESTDNQQNTSEGIQGAVRLGFENTISLREYRSLQSAARKNNAQIALCEQPSFFRELRAQKDASEVARMRAAQAITDAAYSHIIRFIRPGMTEREVQLELEDYLMRHGAEGLAFSSIVATGANGASPHAIPGATRLEAGQCVVLDFGARARGYCSDMTRTVFLGEPSSRMREAYQAIREANEQVEALLKPGVTGEEAHNLAEQVLSDAGFGGKMGHGLGHGVGLDIHEGPVLSPRNKLPLVAGNVVTVEPGIYLCGEFGMRLEDFGVITDSGFDVFTKSSHDPVII